MATPLWVRDWREEGRGIESKPRPWESLPAPRAPHSSGCGKSPSEAEDAPVQPAAFALEGVAVSPYGLESAARSRGRRDFTAPRPRPATANPEEGGEGAGRRGRGEDASWDRRSSRGQRGDEGQQRGSERGAPPQGLLPQAGSPSRLRASEGDAPASACDP